MASIECKCGVCQTIFPVKKDEYLKRHVEDNIFKKEIYCPSCLNKMPLQLVSAFIDIAKYNKTENWEIGTYFNLK